MRHNGHDVPAASLTISSEDGEVVPHTAGTNGVWPHGTDSDDGSSSGTATLTHEQEFAALTRRQLELIGEDPEREGLLQTPARVARAMSWLTRGYGENLRDVVGSAIFEEKYEGVVLVRDIEVYSLCEHHMLPFFGKAHVAYVPDGRVIGLSKIPRLVDVFARRLQVQERLCMQVASAIDEVLRPRGVAVMIEAAHLCMMMRGVERQRSMTVTSAHLGVFLSDRSVRDEFHRLVHGCFAE